MQAHPTRKPARRPTLGALRWLAWIITLLATIAVGSRPALATPVVTAANLPYSASAPGGVNMATGELILVMEPDLFLDGPMPISFQRLYGSMLSSGSGGPGTGHLGPNWLGSFDWNLSLGPTGATVTTNEGQQIQFQPVAGGWALVGPTDQSYRLDFSDLGWRFTDPARRRVYIFNATTGRPQVILDDHGNGLNLFYSGNQLMQVSDGSGRALSFDYDFTGLLRGVSDGTRSVSFGYSGGVLASVTDAAGRTTSYAYTGSAALQDQLQSVTEPLGNVPMTWAYDAFGRVANTTDAPGNSSSFAYDLPAGNTWTDGLGHTWAYAHDTQGRLTSLLDPAGGTTSFTYDGVGRLASSTRPMGDVTSFSYDAVSGKLAAATRGDGSVFSFTYTGHSVAGATLYDVASAHYPDGASESFGRDAGGNLTNGTDRAGLHWTATYNSRGEPLSITNPATGTITRIYDTQGKLTSQTDNAGHTTSLVYDALGRLTKVTWGDGSSRQYAYDPLDHLTALIDEAGKGWTYDYDPDGRLATATNPLIEHEGFVYDGADRLVQVLDGLGHASTLAYDAAGRIASTTDRTGIAAQYQYDALGRMIHVTDPAGRSAGISYDGNGRVPAVQDALGRTTSFLYDAMDRVTHLSDPAGAGVDFAYDAMGRPLSATGPLGHSKTMSYDPRGLVTSFFDATSETDFARTALGEIGQVTDPNHHAWPASHDADGRITSSADPLGRTTSYAYDAAGRMTHATLPLGSSDVGFDAAGRPASIGFSDGTLLQYAWDDAGRMVGGTGVAFAYDAAGRMTSSNGLTLTHDAEGRLTSETYGPGMMVSYAYDSHGRLQSMSDWLGGATTFAYDTTGALVSLIRPNGTSVAYQYDGAGRLADLVEKQPGPLNAPPLAHIAITRDVQGQPVSIDRKQPLMPSVASASNTSLSYDAASQVNGDTYDAMGRMTGDATRALQWDGASRLTGFTAGAEAPHFTYDALGRALSRTMGATSEQYQWNDAMGVPTLDVVSQGTAPTTFYVHTPSGLLLYAIAAAGGARTFYHYDENGNTIFLTDDSGAVTTQYAYSPFGDVSAAGPPSDNPFTLGGASGVIQLGDGLFLAGGGIYDSKTSRMISGGATASGGDDSGPPSPPGNGGGKGGGGGPPPGGSGDGGLGDKSGKFTPIELPDVVFTTAFDARSGPQPLPWVSANGPYPQPWFALGPREAGDGGKEDLGTLPPLKLPDDPRVWRFGPSGDGGLGRKSLESGPIHISDIVQTTAFYGHVLWSANAGSVANRPMLNPSGGASLGRNDGRLQQNDSSSESFGRIKTDSNHIGDGDFGGGYSDGLGFNEYTSGHRHGVIGIRVSLRPGSTVSIGPHSAGTGAGSGKLIIDFPIGRSTPSTSDFCPWCVGR